MNEEIFDTKSLISVTQNALIEEQLKALKERIETQTQNALSLECTDETVKAVKQARATLNRQFQELEARRKEVKAKVLEPYEAFELIYRECVTVPYTNADKTLAVRISDVENVLKQKKTEEVLKYYHEYRETVGLSETDAPFENLGLNITLSASVKSLKQKCKDALDALKKDLDMIRSHEYAPEILVEYRQTGDAGRAMMTVIDRHRRIEAEAQAQKEEAQARETFRNAEWTAQTRIETALQAPTELAIDRPDVALRFILEGARLEDLQLLSQQAEKEREMQARTEDEDACNDDIVIIDMTRNNNSTENTENTENNTEE